MATCTLAEIVSFIGAELVLPGAASTIDALTPSSTVSGVAPLERAKPGELSFLTGGSFEKFLPGTRATAVIVGPAHAGVKVTSALLVHKNPYWAFARAASKIVDPERHEPGVSPHAFIDPTAKFSAGRLTVMPGAFVGAGARLGEGVVLFPGAYVGPGAEIGDHTVIRANAVVEHGCKVGKNCLVHASAVIGADGFGFAPGPGGIAKVPQIGIVVLEDDVEVGAGTTIDRAAFDVTLIKKGAKLDSHVHVGHNCTVGENAMLCGMAGMAGSSSLGNWSILAGNSGLDNQVKVGDNVVIGAVSVVTKDLEAAGQYVGFPAIPAAEWRRQQVLVRKLPELDKRLKELEKMLATHGES